jgi:hypothetical protein
MKSNAHISTSAAYFHCRQLELRDRQKSLQKVTIGCNNENAVLASYEVSSLITVKTENPHTVSEEIILHGAKSITPAVLEKTAENVII